MIGAGATSGGAMDASNLLKPALSSGAIRCIGSTTYKEFRNHFEKDRALLRRFQKIDVHEPTVEDTIKIIAGLRSSFEGHHKVRYTPDAIKSAVELSARYIHDRKLPDKAIDVIDEVGAMQMLVPPSRRKKVITTKEIEAVVATMARIPPKSVSADDKQILEHLDADLKRVVFGQDLAIEKLASAMKLSRAGLRDPDKPIGNYLFSGPTGVGKTEVARQLASIMGIPLQRFDMSEYMERHAVSRLIGAPPGYVGYDQGGLLTDAVDQHPHSVLLLDEIEKAHPDLFNILLQVMDHGKLTDHHGKTVDFRNCILIMTTNAGASDMAREGIGFGASNREDAQEDAVKKMFTPEFRNRLDAIVPFSICRRPSSPAWSTNSSSSSSFSWPTATSTSSSTTKRANGSSTRATTSSTARGRWLASCRRRSSSRWPRNCCSASWSMAARSRSGSRTTPCRSRSSPRPPSRSRPRASRRRRPSRSRPSARPARRSPNSSGLRFGGREGEPARTFAARHASAMRNGLTRQRPQ